VGSVIKTVGIFQKDDDEEEEVEAKP